MFRNLLNKYASLYCTIIDLSVFVHVLEVRYLGIRIGLSS